MSFGKWPPFYLCLVVLTLTDHAEAETKWPQLADGIFEAFLWMKMCGFQLKYQPILFHNALLMLRTPLHDRWYDHVRPVCDLLRFEIVLTQVSTGDNVTDFFKPINCDATCGEKVGVATTESRETSDFLDFPVILFPQELTRHLSWWRHHLETFSALLTICAGNAPVPGEFPAQRPVTPRSSDVFFDLRLNKRLSKQSWGWWFATQSSPLWRQCKALDFWISSITLVILKGNIFNKQEAVIEKYMFNNKDPKREPRGASFVEFIPDLVAVDILTQFSMCSWGRFIRAHRSESSSIFNIVSIWYLSIYG